MKKQMAIVRKWLADPDSVSQKKLEDNATDAYNACMSIVPACDSYHHAYNSCRSAALAANAYSRHIASAADDLASYNKAKKRENT